MDDTRGNGTNTMSDSNILTGSIYYYYADVGDVYERDENFEIKTEIIRDQNAISGQKVVKKYESTLDTREAEISYAKELPTRKKKKIQITKTEPEEKYKCGKCARSYKNRGSLHSHRKFECGVTPQFICKFCDKRFKHKSTMNAHKVRVHPETISSHKKKNLQESKQKYVGYRHQKNNLNTTQAKHICDKCSQAYSSLSGLRYHKIVKHAAVKQPFICDVCGFKTYMKSDLSKHISARHFKIMNMSQARYNCDKCFRNYTSLTALKQHERLKHAAVTPQFICDFCGYKTYIKSNFSRHISSCYFKKSKTSQGRHNCDKCSRSYVWLRDLNLHMLFNHAAIQPL